MISLIDNFGVDPHEETSVRANIAVYTFMLIDTIRVLALMTRVNFESISIFSTHLLCSLAYSHYTMLSVFVIWK